MTSPLTSVHDEEQINNKDFLLHQVTSALSFAFNNNDDREGMKVQKTRTRTDMQIDNESTSLLHSCTAAAANDDEEGQQSVVSSSYSSSTYGGCSSPPPPSLSPSSSSSATTPQPTNVSVEQPVQRAGGNKPMVIILQDNFDAEQDRRLSSTDQAVKKNIAKNIAKNIHGHDNDDDTTKYSSTAASTALEDHDNDHADIENQGQAQQQQRHGDRKATVPRIYNYHDDFDISKKTLDSYRHYDWTDTERTALISVYDDLSLSERGDGITSTDTNKDCFVLPILNRGFTFPGWNAYNQALDENPIITKACTSFCGWFLGDFLTQTVITSNPYDVSRTIILACFGFFFHGPVGHYLYGNLDKFIPGKGPKEITAKIIVDQILWCPVFMVCYFTYLGVMNGDGIVTILEKIHSDMLTAVYGSWKLWPLAHAIQFRYVSTKHRIVYINCLEVCFIMFLSFLGNQ